MKPLRGREARSLSENATSMSFRMFLAGIQPRALLDSRLRSVDPWVDVERGDAKTIVGQGVRSTPWQSS